MQDENEKVSKNIVEFIENGTREESVAIYAITFTVWILIAIITIALCYFAKRQKQRKSDDIDETNINQKTSEDHQEPVYVP